jgi:hypothetical protein
MNLAPPKKSLDVDYLFDNFEDFCEVEFQTQILKSKQPPVVRNLGAIFDQVAASSATTAPPSQTKPLTKCKSSNRQKVVKGSEDKQKKKDGPLTNSTSKTPIFKRKLKLNLKDVFSQDVAFRMNKTTHDSTKSGKTILRCPTSLLNFLRTKTEQAPLSMPKPPPASRSQSKGKGGNNQTKPKSKNVFQMLPLTSSKSKLHHPDPTPATASTKVPLNSAHRSSSLLDTDPKKKPQSARYPRTHSFMATANINSILNSSKQLQYKLMQKAKNSHRSQQGSKLQGHLKTQTIGSAAREVRTSPVQKKRSESKGKYYLPAHVGFKGSRRKAQQNSSAFSEELSQGGRSNYLHRVLFPKVLTKQGCEESRNEKSNKRSRGGTASRLG